MILLIDNYDSFAYNLYQFIGISLAKIKNYDIIQDSQRIIEEIKVIRNDEYTIDEIEKLNPNKIILSPGPGKPEDAGICSKVVEEFKDKIPILGVCLGHQVICEVFGGEVSYAGVIMHGKTSKINLTKDPIFNNIENPINIARYHSLSLKKYTLPKKLEILGETDDNEIMAVKHKTYPIYGLQFHPESILTTNGINIIENFLKL